MTLTSFFLPAYAFAAALSDIRKHQIRNAYALFGLFAGLTYRLLSGGIKGLLLALPCVLGAFLLLVPVYCFRGIGGGDVKLLMALSSFLSIPGMLFVTGLSFVLAAFFGIVRFVCSRGKERTICFAVPVFCSVLIFSVIRSVS